MKIAKAMAPLINQSALRILRRYGGVAPCCLRDGIHLVHFGEAGHEGFAANTMLQSRSEIWEEGDYSRSMKIVSNNGVILRRNTGYEGSAKEEVTTMAEVRVMIKLQFQVLKERKYGEGLGIIW